MSLLEQQMKGEYQIWLTDNMSGTRHIIYKPGSSEQEIIYDARPAKQKVSPDISNAYFHALKTLHDENDPRANIAWNTLMRDGGGLDWCAHMHYWKNPPIWSFAALLKARIAKNRVA